MAAAVGRSLELTVTTDWAGIAVALSTGQVDLAWMGPWGHVLARDRARVAALAIVAYQGKPTYHAIILARPELAIARFPEDAKGLSISFADAGSTSGRLIPHYWFKTQGIDPRTYFKYRDGATHPANDIAVASGQVDLATDYDRNFAAMVAAGRVRPDQARIVWRSEPLPNDALAIRAGLDAALAARLRDAALAIDHAAAARAMRRAGLGDAYRAALSSGLWPSADVPPPAERAHRGRPLAASHVLWPRAGHGPGGACTGLP